MKKIKSKMLNDAIKKHSEDPYISCRNAFAISRQTGVSPAEVGKAIDAQQLKICKCQLGFFTYGKSTKSIQPVATVPKAVENRIHNTLRNNQLSCQQVWRMAKEMHLARLSIAESCDALGIKISKCQLGAF